MGAPEGITNYQWFRFNLYFVVEHLLGLENFNKILGERRSSLYELIDKNLKKSNRGQQLQMPSESNMEITLDEFRTKYIDNFLPVVFRNAAGNWPCVKKWDIDFFEKHYGEREVALSDNEGTIDKKQPQHFEILTFAKYIDELKKGSNKYLKFSRVMDDDETLKKDFDLPWLRKFHQPTSFAENFLMFMGGSNTLTPTHCGFGHSMFIQITGRKKWIFWQPNERIFFDPRAKRRQYNYTDADPYNLNDPAFPIFKYAKRFEVILEPGDALWFPSHLWHHVENLEGGISVVHKFVHLPSCFKSSKVLSTLFFLSTRPNIFFFFFYLKVFKRDYIYSRGQDQLGGHH